MLNKWITEYLYCSCFCPLKLTIFSRVEENEDWVKVMDSIVSVLTGTVVQNRQVPLLPIQTFDADQGSFLHILAPSVANWPIVRPQNSKGAGKKFDRPD